MSQIFVATDSEMSRIDTDDSDTRTKIVFGGMLALTVQKSASAVPS